MMSLGVLGVFDNGGVTLDRYTVVVDNKDGKFYDMLCLSDTGASFSQWSQGEFNHDGDNSHLGEEIDFRDLDDHLQRHIIERLS